MPVFAQTTHQAEPPVNSYNWQDSYVYALNIPSFNQNDTQGDYSPTDDGYCVSFVQTYGHANFKGNADEWIAYINSKTPQIGAVVVLREGYWLGADGKWHTGHLAKVIGISGSKIWLVEQNYEGWQIVSYRTIDIDYENIIGYVLLPTKNPI